MIQRTGRNTWTATVGRDLFTVELEYDDGLRFCILHAPNSGEHSGYGAGTLARATILEELAVSLAQELGNA